MKSAFVALLLLGAAAPASATSYVFDAITSDQGEFTFTVDSSPTPVTFSTGGDFQITSDQGDRHTFWSLAAGGGMDWYFGNTQFYTGTEQVPTFKLGLFDLFDADSGVQLGTLRISDPDAAPGGVPEPASWAMMLSGFGMVGTALRRRKAIVRFA